MCVTLKKVVILLANCWYCKRCVLVLWNSLLVSVVFFFFKQKTAYEILTCDWSSDVCSSDLSSAQLLLCMRWGLQRGGAPKQRPAFAVHEVGVAEGRSPEAALSFC